MERNLQAGIHFYSIGLSYKKADAKIRGDFSVSDVAKKAMLDQAKKEGVPALLILSTCNRTELYGFAQHPFQLIKLLCKHTQGTVEAFEKVAYIHKNKEAIGHLYRVGTGLESQILGDFEIISQIKKEFKVSKTVDMINPFMERLINSVIQASKRIKHETEISSGATSVSFASVQYILKNVPEIASKNILLFGTGKIGRNTCENLVKHTQNKNITLINRTQNRAEAVAGKFDLTVKPYSEIQSEIKNADVLIVATGAQNPTISKALIFTGKPLLILDLSIPKNVSEDVLENPRVSLIHLDHLSQMTDATLQRRKEQIPRAEAIIEEIKTEFMQWLGTRKFAPTIKALKNKLTTLKEAEINLQRKKISGFNEEQAELISNRIIQKITNQFAHHLKNDSVSSDESIAFIESVFQLNNHS